MLPVSSADPTFRLIGSKKKLGSPSCVTLSQQPWPRPPLEALPVNSW